MTEWIWFNGSMMPMSDAHIGVEDRGFQFADGVYEVIRLYGGKPFALGRHLDRLARSAKGIALELPFDAEGIAEQIGQYLIRAPQNEGMIYLQITRGVAPRNHLFPNLTPNSSVQPTVLFYARPLPALGAVGEGNGVKLYSLPDDRWQRCWIKSIALLPNVLAKSAAAAANADEAVFIDRGIVTECSASNLFVVIGQKLITHPVGPKVLPGITRELLLELAAQAQLQVEERAVTEEQAMHADELFITSTTREISWVSHWNGQSVGGGRCGPMTLSLHRGLKRLVARELAGLMEPTAAR